MTSADPMGATGGDSAATSGRTPRRVNDVHALASLAAHHADATVVAATEGLHRAIAGRVFRWVPGSAPVRLTHQAISGLVYASVRLGLRGAAGASGAVAAVAAGDRDVRWLEATPRRSAALSVLHGIVGDRFATDHPDLDLPLRIRVDGRDVAPEDDALAQAFPDARSRVALFLHGLTESDRSWDRRGDETLPTVVLPDVVADLGWTPVRLRYGTGRAIHRGGAELDELLEALLDSWPVEITELCLVGHSMGGLVIRSAAAIGVASDRRWPDLVTATVSLGTPHLGSWLERAANAGTRLLRRLPEGEVVARIIDTRARGIKDLRHGALDDDAWGPGVVHPDGIGGLDGRVPPPAREVPLLPGAVHHLVAGRLTASADHPVTRLIGDLLVTPPSALGDDGRRRLTGGRTELLELPAGHFRLLRDPAVAAHLERWLA